MASANSRTSSGPPFPLKKLTHAPWREQALTKIGEQRFLLEVDVARARREADLRRDPAHDPRSPGRGRGGGEAVLAPPRVRRQIIAWAVLLGYSQQLLTRFVDQRAQTVLDDVGRTAPDRAQPDTTAEPAPAPA